MPDKGLPSCFGHWGPTRDHVMLLHALRLPTTTAQRRDAPHRQFGGDLPGRPAGQLDQDRPQFFGASNGRGMMRRRRHRESSCRI
jgi:hypothetical protein